MYLFAGVAKRVLFRVCYILSDLSCNQVSMETKRVILARLADFDVTAANMLP